MKASFRVCAISGFLCLLFLSFPGNCSASMDHLIKKVQPCTVLVLVYDQNGKGIAQGSGFMLNTQGHLITNFHVLGKGAMARVRTLDGREFRIKAIKAQAPNDDLIEAVVDVSSGSLPYLRGANAAPKPGDPVMVIGSPYGVSKVVSQGTVIAIQDVPKFGRCIVHSAHSFPGSSGSPLVNAQGEVIGIETAAVPGKPDINFAVPLDRFSALSPNYRELGRFPDDSNRLSGLQTEPPRQREAEPTDPASMVNLGLKYEQGAGVAKNCFEAQSIYRKAANQGYAPAQYHLGRMYYDGQCMGKNLTEAAKWVGKSAEKGFPDGQALYANLYFNGEGVPRDRVIACMWTILAASRGHQEANRLLRYMSSELKPEEINAAREKARSWKPAK